MNKDIEVKDHRLHSGEQKKLLLNSRREGTRDNMNEKIGGRESIK